MISRRAITPSTCALYLLGGLVVAAIVLFICLYVGPDAPHYSDAGKFESPANFMRLGFPEEWEFWRLRLLRVAAAGICGWALAASGVALQALLRNALADPYVLGISSGSALGVMIWLVATWSLFHSASANDSTMVLKFLTMGRTLPAAAGAAAACLLVFLLARNRRGSLVLDPLTLLLVGVVVSSICGALIMLLNNFAPGGAITDLVHYLMGSVGQESPTMVTFCGLVVLVGWLPLLFASSALNISTLSDVEVASLGVRIGSLRLIAFFAAALMTAVSIALAGPIGFIGLICPHICRALFGPDHRQLIITAPICGAIVLMLADSFVRATPITFHGELPVGVITALAGGPFFLILLRRANRGALDA